MKSVHLALCVLALTTTAAHPGPAAEYAVANAPIPAPRDELYPGFISLSVDATDTDRKIFRVRERVPVKGSEDVVLLYPKWLPGVHAPAGPIDRLAGLTISADGTRLDWARVPGEVFAFSVTAPQGASALDIEFQYLSPTNAEVGGVEMAADLFALEWSNVVLYPAGYFARQIPVEAQVKLPENWRFATALDAASTYAGITLFKRTTLDTLIDSPIFAGRYFKRIDLSPAKSPPVHLDVVADRPELLEISPAQHDAHRALVRQAETLFGSRHFDHYDFLLTLSDAIERNGLEHHRSSANNGKPDYFTEWDKTPYDRDLLPHEFTHSWNGKFRRPADLWTPSYEMPMHNTLLWVYEGQTQYWGEVLTARSGLWTKQQALDSLALTAARYDMRIGRSWRPLQDTVNDEIINPRRPQSWNSWQRFEDYYSEGSLVWLDADTLIRELSRDQRSLDDFARAFFGMNDGSYTPSTYTFEDVVRTLNSVQPYDWVSFLRTRLDGHGPGAPLDGLRRGGYRLVYTDTPSAFFEAFEVAREMTDFSFSIGLSVSKENKIAGVQWDGPAYRAGLTVGAELLAVNAIAYDANRLKDAIKAAKTQSAAIELLVKDGDRYRTVQIDYHGGARYPHLEREVGQPARLDKIYATRK